MNQPLQQPSAQLNVGHLKNVLLLARHGIAAIGAKLAAHEGKAAFESLGEVEKFVMDYDSLSAPQQVQGLPPAPPTNKADDFEITTVKIGD